MGLDEVLSHAYEPMNSVPALAAAVRMLCALALGGLLGWERERSERAAGLRTHMLVSMAAALFALVGMELTWFDASGEAQIKSDPLALIGAITSGVAFLVAGSIISSGGKVNGLTTGASLWLAGAIGLACGVGALQLAALAAGFALVVLALVPKLRRG